MRKSVNAFNTPTFKGFFMFSFLSLFFLRLSLPSFTERSSHTTQVQKFGIGNASFLFFFVSCSWDRICFVAGSSCTSYRTKLKEEFCEASARTNIIKTMKSLGNWQNLFLLAFSVFGYVGQPCLWLLKNA